jgi:hypothetical protein
VIFGLGLEVGGGAVVLDLLKLKFVRMLQASVKLKEVKKRNEYNENWI